MKKNKLAIVAAITLSVIILSTQCLFDEQDTEGISRVLGETSLSVKDEFIEDRVVIVLTKEASINFKVYSPDDFKEVGCVRIDDSTRHTLEIVKEQLEAEKTGYWSEKLKERAEYGMLIDVDKFRRILELRLFEKNKENVIKAINILSKREDVLYAGPDYISKFETAAVPTPLPEHFAYQNNAFDAISLQDAWGISVGTMSVKIGIIDTGIDGYHNDLRNRVNFDLSRDFTAIENCICGVHCTCGLNPCNCRSLCTCGAVGGTPEFISGFPYGLSGGDHGSFIAGICGGNGKGVIGVNWNVFLVSLKFSDPLVGERTGYSVLRFIIDYANEVGIHILNFSNTLKYHDSIFKYALNNYPGLFVCSAGNSGINIDGTSLNSDTGLFPAGYNDHSNLITVGALNAANDARATQVDWSTFGGKASNYGQTTVDIFAPGTAILSTLQCNGNSCPDGYIHYADGYHYSSGTSFSAPFVAGVAALLKAKSPSLTGTQLREILEATVDVLPSLNGLCRTSGRLNAARALGALADGWGTQNNPFLIKTANQLINISQKPNVCYKLANDINLSTYSGWTPISSFTGTLDGNGWTISNLKININASTTKTLFGLFERNNGTIKNLTVTANINYSSVTSGFGNNNSIYVGVIAGENSGTIDNCKVSTASGASTMIYNKPTIRSKVGGITGENQGTINICTNNGVIYSSGDTGGIAGVNWGNIYNGTNNGMICYTYINYNAGIGGIAGINEIFGNMGTGKNTAMILCGNDYSNSTSIQPRMAHIVGENKAGGTFTGPYSWPGGTVNPGYLQTIRYTSGGVTYSYNQALYIKNAIVGLD